MFTKDTQRSFATKMQSKQSAPPEMGRIQLRVGISETLHLNQLFIVHFNPWKGITPSRKASHCKAHV